MMTGGTPILGNLHICPGLWSQRAEEGLRRDLYILSSEPSSKELRQMRREKAEKRIRFRRYSGNFRDHFAIDLLLISKCQPFRNRDPWAQTCRADALQPVARGGRYQESFFCQAGMKIMKTLRLTLTLGVGWYGDDTFFGSSQKGHFEMLKVEKDSLLYVTSI